MWLVPFACGELDGAAVSLTFSLLTLAGGDFQNVVFRRSICYTRISADESQKYFQFSP
jgi:hypothetical protein